MIAVSHSRMQSFIWPILLYAFTALSDGQYLSLNDSKVKVSYRDCYDSNDESVYDHTFETIDGKRNVSLNEYRNYTLLIVNVATYWGFTYTYPQLNALKQQFINQSFEIIAFPCNQFGQVCIDLSIKLISNEIFNQNLILFIKWFIFESL